MSKVIMLLKKSSFFVVTILLISVSISRGEASQEFSRNNGGFCGMQTSGVSDKKYPFLDDFAHIEPFIGNGINKDKILALTTNEYVQAINEVKSREIEILKNKMINREKLDTIRLITASLIAILIRTAWIGLIKREMFDAGLFALAGAIFQVCYGVFCFGMPEMPRSEIGTDLVKVWTQERKRLFGMTITSLICFAY